MSFLKWLNNVIKGDKKRNSRTSRNISDTLKTGKLMLALEPRYLYDAAGLAAGLLEFGNQESGIGDNDIADNYQFSIPNSPLSFVPHAADNPREIIFVDPTVKDYEKIIEKTSEYFGELGRTVSKNSEVLVVLLDPNQDGVVQIDNVLSQYDNIDAVHIISHGSPGDIILGNAELNTDTIENYKPLFTAWNQHLSQNADILIYGCNVAGNNEGVVFVNQFAEMTGADVAASDDITGADNLGGDWYLEYQFEMGAVETAVIAADGYDYSLATVIVNSNQDGAVDHSDDATKITLRDAIDTANTNGQDDTITFSNDYTITLNSGQFTILTDTTHKLSIDNSGYKITIDGNASSRIFSVNASADLTLDGLTLTNGKVTAIGGGAVLNAGNLKIDSCTFFGNQATGVLLGGAVYSTAGTVNIYNSTFSENKAGTGGFIRIDNGIVNITNSTVYKNDATSYAGGIWLQNGTLNLNNSIVAGNTSPTYTDIRHQGGTFNANYNFIANVGGTIDSGTGNIVASGTLNLDTTLADNGGLTKTHKLLTGSSAIDAGSNTYIGSLTTDQRGSGYDRVLGTQVDIGVYEFGNHAPVLSDQANSLAAIDEDNTTNTGTAVADIIHDDAITDVDIIPSSNAPESIVITAVDNTNGKWQYSIDNGTTWTDFTATTGSAVDISATAVHLDGSIATNKIRFVPNANFNGTVTNGITFRAWDKSDGKSPGNTTNLSGYTHTPGSVFSNATDTASIQINAVNDAPVNTVPVTQIINEDATLTFSTGNSNLIKIDDIDSGISSVKVTLTGTNGTLTLNGASGLTFISGDGTDDAVVTFTGTAANINTALNGMAFKPTADYNGTGSVKIDTDDQGNTGSGGAKTDSDTVSITVNAVNDKPGFTAVNPSAVNEDSGVQSIAGWATFYPNDSNHSDSYESVQTATYTVSNISNSSLFSSSPVIDSTGKLTYTPAANANGTSTFDVTVKDNGGTANGGVDTSVIKTFTITVNTVNNKPGFTAVNPAAVNEDPGIQTVNGWATFYPNDSNHSDSYESVQTATYTVSNISNPSLFSSAPAIDSTGKLTYTPAANANGTSTFDVTVKDNGGTANGGVDTSVIKTFTITVNTVNNKPGFTAVNPAAVNEDPGIQTVNGWATFYPNDSNHSDSYESVQTATYTVSNISNPSLFSSAPAIDSAGKLIYTPAANANGTSTFDVTVKDNGGIANGGIDTSIIKTFTININSENDLPTISDITDKNTNEDTSTSAVNFTVGDLETAAGSLTVTAISSNTVLLPNGNISLGGSGSNRTITLTPADNQNGITTLTVTVSDGTDTASDTFTLTVNSINDPPTALSDVYSATENTTLNGSPVLGNDSDFHSGAPNENNTSLTAQLVSNVSHGTLILNTNGTFTYTPATNFNGADSFTYQAKDSLGGVSNTATVTINVGGVNQGPVATNDSYNTNEDTLLNAGLSLLANDSDSHGGAPGENNLPISIGQIVSGVSNGTLIMNYSDGTFTYTPNANFYGTDTFTYKSKDSLGGESNTATVTITVNPVNDAPTGSNQSISTNEDVSYTGTVNGTDVEGNPLTFSTNTNPSHGTVVTNPDGSFIYTPEANYYGFDSFKFTVTDSGGLSGAGIVSITVNSVNDAPVSQSKTVSTNEDVTYSGMLTATDIENDPLTFSKAGNPSHGSATVNADGTFTYTPSSGYFGTDTFTFTVNDGKGGSGTGTVNITVTEVADPNANDDLLTSISEDTQLTFTKATLLSNDTDVNNVSSWTQPSNGTLAFDGTTFIYKPNANFFGNDSFKYTASNNNGATDDAIVYITVTSVNDTPAFISTPVISVNEDNLYTYSITTSDPDDAGNYLTISALTKPDWLKLTYYNNGTATLSGTPTNSEVGYHGVKIQVKDDDGAYTEQGFTIRVENVNDCPDAKDISITTNEGVSVPVHFEISDIDGDNLSISYNQPANGTIFFNGTEYTYTPHDFYHGTESFTYTASDGKCSDTGIVTITVQTVNNPPDAADVSVTTKRDTQISIDLSKSASDSDNDKLTFTTILPSHGTLGGSNGIYIYTPSTNYVGTDTFTYTASDWKTYRYCCCYRQYYRRFP